MTLLTLDCTEASLRSHQVCKQSDADRKSQSQCCDGVGGGGLLVSWRWLCSHGLRQLFAQGVEMVPRVGATSATLGPGPVPRVLQGSPAAGGETARGGCWAHTCCCGLCLCPGGRAPGYCKDCCGRTGAGLALGCQLVR